MGGSVPSSMLKYMYKDLTKDASRSLDIELDEGILNYCLSKGDKDLWPDLQAANSGATNKYDIFFSIAEKFVEEISGAESYRRNEKNYITSDNVHLTSISALHKAIIERMKQHEDKFVREAPTPSQTLLQISLCPQYESRLVSRYYSRRLNLTRAIQKATMRKFNIDSHYNHKINQYGNKFIIELNNLIYSHLNIQHLLPTLDNDIILSKGITKISVDDKAAVPIGEPGLPVRTNAQKK